MMDQTNQESQVTAYSEKRRGTYQLLAFLLGGFGVHNFYAGRIEIGMVQLIFTIVQISACMACEMPCIAISAIWAFIEIFAIKKDGKGLPFKKSFV